MWLTPVLAFAQTTAWAPCIGIDTAPEAECLPLTVPEDYGNPGDGVGIVHVLVARVPSVEPASRHVWITAREPGGSALAELLTVAERDWPDDVELYAVDHRGVGASRLVCPDQESEQSPGGPRILATEIGPCSQHLESQLGALQFVDATQSGGDLMEVSEQLKGDADVFLMGTGYGAFVVQRALVLSGRPEGVIIDGPWADDANLGAWDAGLDATSRALALACDRDASCRDALTLPIVDLVDDFVADPAACDAFVDRFEARRTVAGLMRHGPELQGLLPTVLDRALRCDDDDVEVLTHLVDALAALDEHPAASPATALHLAYGELWQGGAPDDSSFLASSGASLALREGAADWTLPFAPAAPKYPTHRRPVLLLHPEQAPLTDPIVGSAYDWEEHHQLDVEGAYGSVTDTECGHQLVLDFLDDPSQAPAPCAAQPDFEGDVESNQRWLGSEERWAAHSCGGCGTAPASTTTTWFSRRRARPGTQSPR